MNTRIANIISILGIAALIVYVAIAYSSLPDPMPTHWNAAGEVNGWSHKQVGVAILTGVPIFFFVLFKLIPVISPRGFRTESFREVLNILMAAVVIFGAVIGVGVIRAAGDASIDISTFVLVAVGLLIMVMGNFLGKVRKNFFLGIRTPWTLASDEVWAKTHRLGGWCFVVAGLFMVVMGLFAPHIKWIVWVVVAVSLIPVVYSYLAYRRIEGFAPDPDVDDDG